MTVRAWLLLLILAATAACPLAAFQRVRLGNGLTVLVAPDDANVVSIRAALRITAGDEPVGQEGVRFLTQQLLLRGTAGCSGRELAKTADALGAVLQAGVETDYVYLQADAPAEAMPAVLTLVSQALLQPSFPEAEVEAAKEAALRLVRPLAPGAAAQAGMLAGLYGAHPYARGESGVGPAVARLSRAAVVAFHRRCYVPERTVVAVCGRVDVREALALATRLLGGWAPGSSAAVCAAAPAAQPDTRPRVCELPVSDCYLMLGFRVPGLADADYPALAVLNTLLGMGMGSRLYAAMRDREGLAYQVYSRQGQLLRDNYLAITVVVPPGRLEAARQAVLAEIAQLQQSPPSEAEMLRARRYTVGTYLLDHQRNRDLARYLCWYEVLGLGYTYDERFPALVERVGAADLMRVARQCLQRGSLSVVLPEGMAPKENAQKPRPARPIEP